MRTILRITRWLFVGGIGALVLGAVATWIKHSREIDSGSDEQKIARSLSIIRTSTPDHPKVLKVLFYGQSITGNGWPQLTVEHWLEKYPSTIFVVENRALGGFDSRDLLRAAERDVVTFYPDLIVFHVYGDHRAYENIIRLFRSRTAADVILQTDHGEVLPDPPCPEGLRITLRRPAGCVGTLWLRQRLWSDEMSYHKLPAIAKKYGAALEPQRSWWRAYLLSSAVDPSALLADGLHPNELGKELIASFFNRYFDNLVSRSKDPPGKDVVSLQANPLNLVDRTQTVKFDGSRLELLSSKPIAAWPKVTIDGSPPADFDGCYQVSRTSSIGTVPEWPAVRRISLQHDHKAEIWTATITTISPDQKDFAFTVKATSGDEGGGISGKDFTARSGRLRIDAQDWMPQGAFEVTHVALHMPFVVQWRVNYVCGGDPEVIDMGRGTSQYRYVIGTGLGNGHHSAKLLWSSIDVPIVTEFRSYKPRLLAF